MVYLRLYTLTICWVADIAFVDRADIKAYVGPPSLQARYEILRSCLQELLRTGILASSKVWISNPTSCVNRTASIRKFTLLVACLGMLKIGWLRYVTSYLAFMRINVMLVWQRFNFKRAIMLAMESCAKYRHSPNTWIYIIGLLMNHITCSLPSQTVPWGSNVSWIARLTLLTILEYL